MGCGGSAAAAGAVRQEGAVQQQETAETAKADAAREEASVQEEARAEEAAKDTGDKKELIILAAASLTDVCGELETLYEAAHPDTELTFSFGSSGALQTQIEEGAPADIFFSASTKQMNALDDEGLMDSESITELLENKIVLVIPTGSDKGISAFEDAATDKVGIIGLGDPESVPAGQYAEEVFTSLGILDDVKAKANYGSDVRTVLTWVEAGEVDCGVVYKTDALTTDAVEIVTEAPEGSCKKVIYPIGIVNASENQDASKELLDFFKGEEAGKVFEKHGF
ncbi:MAG: molybdate ABC transporter substrate-binding protein [Lachnospiraceae bacterium]|nr:molybdate ABC transporter substrate-binding protein [Lachnospiraceae bacterium]